jgi:hypothetical protein
VIGRAAYVAAVLVGLAVSRLLPEHGLGLFLRLGAATLVVLLPGRLIARALGLRSTSATLAWTLAALTAALGVVFLAHSSFTLALLLLLALGLGALFLPGLPEIVRPRGRSFVAAAGLALGIAVWHIAPKALSGDSPFHVARVRKLVDLGSLTPWRLDELAGGGLHPGYAFPLWHAFLAAVTKLSGVDPAVVFRYESSLLVPIAALVAYEAGVALFRTPLLGAATAAAQVALIAFAPGHGGTYPLLARPAPAARQLLVPAVLALVFAHAEQPSWRILATAGAASLALTLVHPTYALFLCIPLAGCVLVRALVDRRDTLRIAAGLAAVAVPAAAVSLALLPIARDTVSHEPSSRALRRSLAHYHDQLVVHGTSYHLRPEVFGRNGAVAVAGLLLVPLAALAWRRRWSSFVLGGSLAVLAVTLVPFLFEHLSDAVSLSQSRRAAGFLPFTIAFVGGLIVFARLLHVLVLPLALAAGIVFELLWPGDFGFRLEHGGPQHAAWIAAAGGALALAAVLVLVLVHRRPLQLDGGGLAGLAAGLFVLPVAVHGFSHWSSPSKPDRYALTPGLVRVLREDVPKRGVVFSDPETSYRIAAYAPVLIVAAPVEHVADTKQNDPYGRRDDVRAFLASGDLAIPRRYGARWLVLARSLPHPAVALRPVYSDARFVLYRI